MRREQKAGGRGRRACCMVSELLEEAGIDRASVRRVRKQVLEGVILLCRWQLERMERGSSEPGPEAGGKGRRIRVE